MPKYERRIEVVAKAIEEIIESDSRDAKDSPSLSRLPKTPSSWIGFVEDAKKILSALDASGTAQEVDTKKGV
jgi:hypothetical protein